jgi:dienelactone hydrolase
MQNPLDSFSLDEEHPSQPMSHLSRARLFWLAPVFACLACLVASAQETVPGSQALTLQDDLSAQMVADMDKFFTRELEQAPTGREKYWRRDFSSVAVYEASVQTNREHLRKIIGAVDARLPVTALEYVSSTASPATVAETEAYTVKAVRWPVFEGVFGEGLFLEPKQPAMAAVVAIPDADQTPEMLAGLAAGLPPERQFARRLAESGCAVLVPVLIDRQDTWSSKPEIDRVTNLPHREWIYRQAYPLGGHIIGYEVQKVLAGVDFFAGKWQAAGSRKRMIGLAGYGEGGLIAFYAAALDRRIEAVLVSGYFDSRQRLWEEPIYRNVFSLLREFGDAEIASLIAPRALIVEYSQAPKVPGPPKPRTRKPEAAPGKITTPDYATVEGEFERARGLIKAGDAKTFDRFKLIAGTEGMTTGPGSDRALVALLESLGVAGEQLKKPAAAPTDQRGEFDPAARQHRQLKELEDYTQALLRGSERTRAESFWARIKATTPGGWETACAPFKQYLWQEILGRLPSPALPANPRTRRWDLAATNAPGAPPRNWTGYEVMLDVYLDVFAWGILLVPKDIKPGERRPVVVCQHGLEGLPSDVITSDPESQGFRYYSAFAARLAERGFITFAPHNPYRGENTFREVQRKANPVGASIYSVIVAQHSRILDWLETLPFVDPKRIGFYGLSYGGATAMRVPALLDRYVLSICSGSFNDWTRKVVSTDYPGSYMFVGEYEVSEFAMGETFGNAEMAALIAPRPFMVERGHSDPVGLDEWVASEYAKVRRLYDRLGIGNRTTIEYFNGGHKINGVGTFDFLHQQLGWPKPGEQR